ncbi:MAG TPA: cytochrome c [Candidatus Acidoferrum sp.]|nr:cytochrome c [Candidatus Acidoferrum sp.]
MKKTCIRIFCLSSMMFLVGVAIAQEPAKPETSSSSKPTSSASLSAAASNPADKDGSPQGARRSLQGRPSSNSGPSQRAEGEQRFRENCGRCHQPPRKFPPRVMAAAIRHMRVRAMLTDEDMRLILKYMTQ